MNFERRREIIDEDPETGTYRATYTYPSEPPSIAVPLALMEVTDCGMTDLDPLYDATNVDPDALDELFRPTSNTDADDCQLTFTYQDYVITVKQYGRIVVRSSSQQERLPS